MVLCQKFVVPNATPTEEGFYSRDLSKRKLIRALRAALSDDVYYQQSKESDVGSLAHAQQSSQSR